MLNSTLQPKTSLNSKRKPRIVERDSIKELIVPMIDKLNKNLQSITLICKDVLNCGASGGSEENCTGLSCEEENKSLNQHQHEETIQNEEENCNSQPSIIKSDIDNINQEMLTSIFKSSDSQARERTNEGEGEDNVYQMSADNLYEKTLTEDIFESGKELKGLIVKLRETMIRNRIKSENLFKRKDKGYSILTQKKKDLICQIARHFGPGYLSHSLNMSKKSLMRWLKKGTHRRIGGGRKILDPEMEITLVRWYIEQMKKNNNKGVPSKVLKKKAIEFSNHEGFLASKGWFEKFRKKYCIVIAKPKSEKNNIN